MSSKLIGSALIIAGTTIGAGMLALPLASAGLGLTTSVAIMTVIWCLMSYTALLMLEVHQHAPAGATLHSLAHQFLGRRGQILAAFATLFLFYSLCAAYIAGGGGQLNEKLSVISSRPLPDATGTLLFTGVIAGVIMLGTRKVDLINRGLFALKLITLALALTLLTPHVSQVHLLDMPLEKGLLISAIPVIFTSFGFHGSIPSVVGYFGLDIRSLRKVLLAGSSLPLLIYIMWQTASLGSIGQEQLVGSNSLPGFLALVGQVVNQPAISGAISLFADLALATSFLGVSLGLFDFLSDTFKRSDKLTGRLQTGAITFLPPLVIALFYPQGFISALGYAAIALVILAIVLPVLMVRKVRQMNINKDKYQVGGGNWGLSLAMIGGIIVVSTQLLQSFG